MIEPSHIVVLGNLHMDRDMQEGRFGNERSRTAWRLRAAGSKVLNAAEQCATSEELMKLAEAHDIILTKRRSR